MILDPTLTVSMTRTLLPGSLPPLEFSATLDGTTLGIAGFQRPGAIARNGYAPANRFMDGLAATSSAWEKASLGLDWFADLAETETDNQAAYNEVWACIGQFRFLITTKVSDAPAQVWIADRGSMSPNPLTYLDMVYPGPVYPVTIPVHPIPGVP